MNAKNRGNGTSGNDGGDTGEFSLVPVQAFGPEEQERLVRTAIEEIRTGDSGLTLGYLGRVLVSHDLVETLAELSAQEYPCAKRFPNKPPTGLVCAVHTALEEVLLVHPGFLSLLLSADRDENAAAIALLHHELCRVHEHTHRTRERLLQLPECGQVETLFQNAALCMWEEYFASRRAFRSRLNIDESRASVMPVMLFQTQQDMTQAVEDYALLGNQQKLLIALVTSVEAFARHCGLVLGELYASGQSLYHVDARADAAIDAACLGRDWPAWANWLDQLYSSFGYWENPAPFTSLTQSISNLAECVGCALRNKDGQISVQLN